MKNYEITFITKEDQKEKPIKPTLEKLGGKILNVSSLGQKNFAYPIKKEKSGFYTTVNFEIEPEKVVELNKKLGLEEEILRFLMINIKPLAQIAEPAPTKIIEEPFDKTQGKPKQEIVAVEEVKEKPKKIAKPKKVSKAVKELIEEPVSESERLDALDKKLEELLKE